LPNPVLLAVEPDKLHDWTLVLDAEGIPYRVVRQPDGWSVAVRSEQLERVIAVLSEYEIENPVAEAVPDQYEEYGRTYVGGAVAIALAAFFVVTGPAASGSHWFADGAAVSELIRDGEFWRAVTALTLHADFGHILSNTLSAVLFFTALFQLLGPGLGLTLVLGSGAVGNVLNAYAHGVGHRSIGASTAIFGSLGLLVGVALIRRRRLGSWRRAWGPVVAGIALLGLLGTAESTDIAAHAYGFLAGLVFGIVAGHSVSAPPGRPLQLLLGLAATAVVVVAWFVALTP
jgi:membrane associated rhomboid family serine protease